MSLRSTRFIMSSFARLISSSNHFSNALTSNGADRALGHQQFVTPNLGYRYVSNFSRMQNYNMGRRNFSVYNNNVPPPLPTGPASVSSSSPIRNWIVGLVLSFILPFFGNKWGPLLQFKTEVDTVVDTIEEIVDVVEKVAVVVETVAEDISKELPAGGKFKRVVDAVEDVAEETAKTAHIVGDAIDKFQEVEGKVENIVGLGKIGDHEGNRDEDQNSQEAKSQK